MKKWGGSGTAGIPYAWNYTTKHDGCQHEQAGWQYGCQRENAGQKPGEMYDGKIDGAHVILKLYAKQALNQKTGEIFTRAYNVHYIEK